MTVQRLNRAEFADALRKGQGRVMLYVREYGLEGVTDLLLEACIHNQVYDQQLESGRGKWLFAMFRNTPQFSEIRDAILQAIEIEADAKNLFQLCQLAGAIATLGDAPMHQALGRVVFRDAGDPASDETLGVEEWLDLEGVRGMLELARIYGRQLLRDPERFVVIELLVNERHPEFRQALSEAAKDDPEIKAYYAAALEREKELFNREPIDLETDRQARHERARREYPLERILTNARAHKGKYPGRYMDFGRHATPEELETVFTQLLREPDPAVQMRLLWVFRRAILPRLDPQIFAWANGEDEGLRSAAIAALARISDPQGHRLAREKVETGQLLGADQEALNLFLINYEGQDAGLIARGLAGIHPNAEEAHRLGYSAMELAEKVPGQELAEAVVWVYEQTPCAFCRYKAVKWLDQLGLLTAEQLRECPYDANDDIRKMVPPPGYHSASSVHEILQRYAQGERFFGYTDLEDGADFSSRKLADVVFDHSFISDADFTGADLQNVSFRAANVKCNDFSNANLEGADFRGAFIEATCFAGANLKNTQIVGASYYGLVIQEDQVPELLEILRVPFQKRLTKN